MEAIKHILNNILSFSPQNTSVLVWLFGAGLWILVLLLLLHDVFTSNRRGALGKATWCVILTGLPIMSGIFYTMIELARADWSASLGGLIRPKSSKNKFSGKK
jgi:hypothetical protein